MRGVPGCVPELILGMGLPAVSPEGTGAVSYCAFPMLPVCARTGWGDGGVCFPGGFYELTWAARNCGCLGTMQRQAHPKKGWVARTA